MTPFFFGAWDRRLFGVYEPPRRSDRQLGAVLCYPIGSEYYHSYHACRFLARLMAQAGIHVLRFDYLGMGDSAVEVRDVVVDDWLENIGQAVDELKDRTGLRTAGLVGLRFGAALAACVAQMRSDVDRLVLWDPVANGSECVGLLGKSDRQGSGTLVESAVESAGDVYTKAMVDGLRGITAESYCSNLPRSLIVSTVPDERAYQALEELLGSAAATSSTERRPGPSTWAEPQGSQSRGMPVPALRIISEWLAKTP